MVGWCPFIISLMTNSNHFYSKQFSFSKINIKYDIRYVIYTRPNLVLPVERYHLQIFVIRYDLQTRLQLFKAKIINGVG